MSRPCVAVKPDPSLPAPNLTVLDLDSPFVRALQKKNKRRQGWSLSMLFRSPRPRPASPANLHRTSVTTPCNHVADSLPSSSDPSPLTEDFLSSLNQSAVENFVTSHCWWTAAAGHAPLRILDLMLRAVEQTSLLFGIPISTAWSLLLTPTTTTEQIALAVTALSSDFGTGLLIAHDPCSGVYLFRPGLSPKFVTHSMAIMWQRAFPSTPVMLFTKATSATVGHFQRCLPKPSHGHGAKSMSNSVPVMPVSSVTSCNASASPGMSGGTFRQRFQGYANLIDLERTNHLQANAPAQLCRDSRAACLSMVPPSVFIKSDSDSDVEIEVHSNNGTRFNPLAEQLPSPPRIDFDSGSSSSVEYHVSSQRTATVSDDGSAVHGTLAEPVPGPLTPLPWQDSPRSSSPSHEAASPVTQQQQVLISATLPFEIVVAATWLDRLHPSLPSAQAQVLPHTAPSLSQATLDADDAMPANTCNVCHAFNLQECHCLLQQPGQSQISPPSPSQPGCSCVGVYGLCVCGFAPAYEQSQSSLPRNCARTALPRADSHVRPNMEGASFANLRVSTQTFDLDSDSEVEGYHELRRLHRRSRSRSSPSRCSLPVRDRVNAFWRARRSVLQDTVATLYAKHMRIDARETSELASLFHALPGEWPVQPQEFGLSLGDLFQEELELWKQRAAESYAFEGTIADAWNSELDIAKLLPFFLCVLCLFAEKAGIAREFPFGFCLTMAPWVCHRSLHACFNPLKPEHEARPRLFVNLIAESNCGKSPFFRQCVDSVFITHLHAQPCLIDRFPNRFAMPGPGKDKTLFVQQCTNSDFARRMKATNGHLCWLSEEAWSALDVAWAKGKGRAPQSDRKVQHCYLQNTQNGQSYGPLSINSEQFFVPTTNFAFFHAGQPKVVHDYWGQAFIKDCPFGGMGWEFRPTFLWPRDQPEHDTRSPQVTFTGAARFIQDLFSHLAMLYGQALDCKSFSSVPIPVSDEAARLWSQFKHQAEGDKQIVPPCAAGAVGKHCFTTTSHILACHLLQEAFLDIKTGRVDLATLRAPTREALDFASTLPWPQSIRPLQADLVATAPEHLHIMLTGVLTCFNEMKLSPQERAGPEVLDEQTLRPRRRQAKQEPEHLDADTLSNEEAALGVLLRRFPDRDFINVTMVNEAVPRRFGFRSDQVAICRVFDLAAQYHAGVREGSPNASLRLRLTLSHIDASFRRRLNLPLATLPHGSDSSSVTANPFMMGAGKRPLQGKRGEMRKPAAAEQPQPAKAKKLQKTKLLEPIYIPADPVTTLQVEHAVNAALQVHYDHVHGKPFHIKVTTAKRKKKTSFQLRCGVCQHGTCSWWGSATLNTATSMLSSTYMSNRAHGQVKTAKAASGRKVGQTAEKTFALKENLAYEGNLDQESIGRAIEKHFENKPLEQTLHVLCRPRKPTKKGPTCVFSCCTHWNRDTEATCKWGGAASVVTRADGGSELRLRYHTPDVHAPHELQLYNTLTWRQRQAAKRCPHPDTHSVTEAVHAIKPTNAADAGPVLKRGVLAGFAARCRKKSRPADQEAPRNPPGHSASDFEYCQDRCNASLARGQCRLLPNSPCLVTSDYNLRVVDMRMNPQHVCVPLICPELLHLTLSLLPKPWNFKASTDGTYRLLFDGYALLTFGLNVKNWSARKDLKMHSFRSSFVPLAFALANKENDDAYTHLGQTLFATAQTLGHELEPDSILQWHGDMHLGIEAARKTLAPGATRLSDWAHVTGATSQGPSGFAGLLSKELPRHSKDTLLPWLLQFCRISKEMPALLFHVVWSSIFVELQQRCDAGIVRKLQNQYFTRVTMGANADARWDAPWRAAPDRIMPGTDAGSAPQESWHGTVLKPIFGSQRRKPAEVAHILQQQIVQPQLRALRAMKNEGEQFQDWPGIGQFLDQHVLQGDVKLQKEGRTSAKTLLAWGLHSRFEDELGNLWMLIPTSKLKRDWVLSKGGKNKYKNRTPISLPPNAIQQFAAFTTATSVAEVESALSALGLYDTAEHSFKDWRAAAKMFDDWRLVVSGPFSANLWRHHRVDPVDEQDARSKNKHTLYLCFGCHAASLWGPCEHAYACMEHEGQSSMTILPKAKPKGRPAKRRIEDRVVPPQIVPGPSLSLAAPHEAGGDRASSSPSLAPAQLALRSLLRSASLGQFFQPMMEQGVTVPALRRFHISDFFTFFRMSVGDAHSLMGALDALSTAGVLDCFSAVDGEDAAESVEVQRVPPMVSLSQPAPAGDQAEERRKYEKVAVLGAYGLLKKPLSEPAPHSQLSALLTAETNARCLARGLDTVGPSPIPPFAGVFLLARRGQELMEELQEHAGLQHMLSEWMPTRRILSKKTFLQKIARHLAFKLTVILVIVANCIYLGWDADLHVKNSYRHLSQTRQVPNNQALALIFPILFVVELLIRVGADRMNFFRGDEKWWNIFDIVLVLNSLCEILFPIADLSFLRLLRVFRMVRVIRVVKNVKWLKSLRTMVFALINSFVSLMWAFFMIMLIIFVFSILFCHGVATHNFSIDLSDADRLLEAEEARKTFGTLWETCVSLFSAVTGGNDWYYYAGILRRLGQDEHDLTGEIYLMVFAFYVSFCTIGLLNVVTGIFVDSAVTTRTEDEVVDAFKDEMNNRQQEVRRIFTEAVGGDDVS
eukprot:s1998_g5.t1